MAKHKTFSLYLIGMMLIITFPFTTNAQTSKTFIDVNDKTVSPKSTQHAIYELVELDAISGYSDNTFKPNKPINRAQVAKILTGALGLSLPQNLDSALKKYQDVGPNHEYAVFIAATTVTNVFQGKEDGLFDPWSNITREQMAIVLGRILEDYNTEENVDVNVNNIGKEAQKYVQIIANLGVTTEVDNFRPHAEVTRAQFAAFAYRTLTVIDENSLTP